jgi:hypothetical protein
MERGKRDVMGAGGVLSRLRHSAANMRQPHSGLGGEAVGKTARWA